MGLIGRLKIGFAMARRSGRVLRFHPRLLVFPLLGGLYVMSPLLQDPGPAMYATLFVAYLLETFVASFFTVVRGESLAFGAGMNPTSTV